MYKKIVQVSWLSAEDIRDQDKLNYRRFKLAEYLKKYYDTDYFLVQSSKDLEAIRIQGLVFDICYVSKPYKILQILPGLTYNKLIYDRSDSWSGTKSRENFQYTPNEQYLFDNAKKIIYVSRNMLDNKYRDKMIYITNGTTIQPYDKSIEKFPKKTAIYIGRSVKKLNIDWLTKAAKFNEDWDFLIYGISDEILSKLPVDISNLIWKGYLPEDELFKIIEKCHVGLIPFIGNNVYVQGMCPLKIFQYCNAHIPTAYLNSPECSFYPNIAFDLDVYNLNSIANQNIPSIIYNKILEEHDWNNIFKKIIEVIESV